MIAELGQFILALTLAVAFCQVWFCFMGVKGKDYDRNVAAAAYAIGLLLVAAFVLLVVSFLRSDFSLALVANHSHSTKPWFYKIAASWGNHEGSLLLWVLLLGVYGAAFAFLEKRVERQTKLYTLMVQAVLVILFLSFLIWTSNPFARIEPLVFQGLGLNPVLQDVALVIHPPILYLGYVGFSIVFSLSLGGLLAQGINQNWVRLLVAPVQLSWVALTIGIALGSWWAYRELGWGGFWFWDPVENSSLMPWLVATALLHSLSIARNKGIGLNWVVLLGIFTFLFSILGTFLTRSGLITSVHSFASDPARGVVILSILVLLLVSALYLYSKRQKIPAASLDLFSREASILANNLFLLSATLSVLVGTIYPMILEGLTGDAIAVGAPYFEASFVPIMILPVMMMPLAFFFGRQFKQWGFWFAPALLVSLLGAVLWQGSLGLTSFGLASFGLALALWLVLGSITSAILLRKRSRLALAQLTAHTGLGVLLAGAIAVTSAQEAEIYAFNKNETINFAAYQIKFIELRDKQGKDYRAEEAELALYQEGELVAKLYPQVRHYIARPQATREAAIYTSFVPLADFHAILGDKVENKHTVQFYYNPLAPLLWLGAGLIALGGIFSFFRRRQ